MGKESVKKLLTYVLSVLLIVSVWFAYSLYIKAPLILPSPLAVSKKMSELFRTPDFYNNLFTTVFRVFGAFFISIILGAVLGFLSSVSDFVKNLLKIPVSIIRVTPVAAVILLALFWFNSSTVPVFVSVLMAFPVMYSAVEKGLSDNNSAETEKLLMMAQVYNFNNFQIYKYIRFPGGKAAFLSGMENCFGLCWKVTVAGEVLSLPKAACGTMLQKAQVHLETAEVLAITVVLILISFIFQLIIKGVSKKYD